MTKQSNARRRASESRTTLGSLARSGAKTALMRGGRFFVRGVIWPSPLVHCWRNKQRAVATAENREQKRRFTKSVRSSECLKLTTKKTNEQFWTNGRKQMRKSARPSKTPTTKSFKRRFYTFGNSYKLIKNACRRHSALMETHNHTRLACPMSPSHVISCLHACGRCRTGRCWQGLTKSCQYRLMQTNNHQRLFAERR